MQFTHPANWMSTSSPQLPDVTTKFSNTFFHVAWHRKTAVSLFLQWWHYPISKSLLQFSQNFRLFHNWKMSVIRLKPLRQCASHGSQTLHPANHQLYRLLVFSAWLGPSSVGPSPTWSIAIPEKLSSAHLQRGLPQPGCWLKLGPTHPGAFSAYFKYHFTWVGLTLILILFCCT